MAQDPQVQPPLTHDQMAGAGLAALKDLVESDLEDGRRARAARAFEKVYRFASEEGALTQGNPAVQDMWQSWLRRAGSTTKWDAARRAHPEVAGSITDMAPTAPWSGSFMYMGADSLGDALLLKSHPKVATQVSARANWYGGERDGTFLVKDGALNVPVDAHSRRTQDFRQVLGAPARIEGGQRVVDVAGGSVAIPDISSRRDVLRQFLVGKVPGTFGVHAKGQLATELVSIAAETGVGVFGDMPEFYKRFERNVPSALGTQRFAIPFFDEHGKNLAAMQDPAYMRALQDLTDDLEAKGELEPRWWEKAAEWGMFGLEFAVMKGAAKAAAAPFATQATLIRKAPAAAWMARTFSAGARAVGAERSKTFIPLFQHGTRSAMEMALFESVRKPLTGTGTPWEGALAGGKMGFEMAVLGEGFVVSRRLGGWLLGRNKVLGGWLNNVRELLERRGESDFLGRKGHEKLLEWTQDLPSSNPSLVRALQDVTGSSYAAEYALKVVDMAAVSMLFAGTEHAQVKTGKHWLKLLYQDPVRAGKLIIEGMFSEQAVGNFAGFLLGSMATVGSGRDNPYRRMRGTSPDAAATAERAVQDLAWSLSRPTDPEKVAEAGKLFGLIKRLHPELVKEEFQGLTAEPTRGEEPGAGPSAAPAGPPRPKPDFEGPASPSGRSRERVAEMFSHWRAAAPQRTGKTFRWRNDISGEPRHWVQTGEKYAVALGKDDLYRIIHAGGERVARGIRGTKAYPRLEDAIAVANKLGQKAPIPWIPAYTTDRDASALFPKPAPGAPQRAGHQVKLWEEAYELQRSLERASPEDRPSIEAEIERRVRDAGSTPEEWNQALRARRPGPANPKAELQLELERREVLYQKHRADPDMLGLSPENVVQRAQAREAARLEARTRAKYLGITEHAYEQLRALSPESRTAVHEAARAAVFAQDAAKRRALNIVKRKLGAAKDPDEVRLLESERDRIQAELAAPLSKAKIDPATPIGEQLASIPQRERVAMAKELRRRHASARAKARLASKELDLVDYLRKEGGINATKDAGSELWDGLRHLNKERRPPGLGNLVHGPDKKGRGMSWEDAVQAAREGGYFGGEDVSVNDLMDALHSRKRITETDADLARFEAEEAARVEPDPDMPGLDPVETVERVTEGLGRAESAREAEAHREAIRPAGPPRPKPAPLAGETSTVLGQASERALAARELLELANIVDPWEPLASTKSALAMRELADGGAEHQRELAANIPLEPEVAAEMVARGVEHAREWMRAAREATVQHAETIGQGDKVRAYLRAVDELKAGGALSPEAAAELKKAGLANEHGGLHESAPKEIGQLLQNAIWDAQDGEPRAFTYLYGGLNPWVVSGFRVKGIPGLTWKSPDGPEFIASKLSRALGRSLEMLSESQSDARTVRYMRGLNRWLTMSFGRFWSGAGWPALYKDLHQRLISNLATPAARERAASFFESQRFLSRLRVEGKLIPRRAREDIVKLMDAGYFRGGRIKTPEDLAKHVSEQYAHLFFDIEREVGTVTEMGRTMRDLGAISDAQFAQLERQYVMRSWLRAEKRTLEDELRDKNYAVYFLPARDMARTASPELAGAVRNWDPDAIFSKQHAQEGKIIELMRWLHGLADQTRGFSFSHTELTQGNAETGRRPWSAADLEWVDRAAIDPARITKRDRDPLTGRQYSTPAKRMGVVLKNWRDSMQSEAEWRANAPLREGQHPYTPAKADLIEALMPADGSPGLYIDRGSAAELEMVRWETFYVPYQPGDGFTPWFGDRVDDLSRYWRKAHTVNNPLHWSLNIISSVFTNWQTGGVSPYDLARSIMTGEGHYANSMRRLLWWEKWMANGRPSGEAELRGLDLLEAHRNGWLAEADELVGTLGAGTFHRTLIDTGVITNLLGGLVSREEIRTGIQGQLKRGAKVSDVLYTHPRDVDQALVEQLTDAVVEMNRRNAGGAGRIDRMLVDLFASSEKDDRVKAIAHWGATYQLWELMFKYSNSLGILSENPGMKLAEAVNRGARGTADYRDTSPVLRRWTTGFNISSDWISKQTDDAAAGKAALRFAFAGPFMLYRSAILPSQFHGMLARPLRSAAMGAAWAGIAAGLTKVAGYGLHEMFESLPGTPGFQGMKIPNKDDLDEYARRYAGSPQPIPGGGRHSLEQETAWGWLWPKIAARIPFVAYAPQRGPDSRIADLGDFAQPFGVMNDWARTIQNWPQMTSVERGEAFARGLYGLQPMALKAALTMGAEGIFGKPGESYKATVVRNLENLADEFLPLLHPVTAMVSPQARRAFGLGYADGMPLGDWLAGKVDPFAKQRSVGRGLSEFLFSSAISTRKVAAYNAPSSPDEPSAVLAMIREALPNFEASMRPADQTKMLTLAKGFRDQVALLARSTYATYREAPAGISFEDLLKEQFDLFKDVQLDSDRRYTLARNPSSPLGQYIAAQPADQQPLLLDFAIPFLGSRAFREDVVPSLIESANSRSMDPAFFHRLFKAALTGPHDAQVLATMESDLLERKQYEWLPEYYDLFTRMGPPQGAGGSRRFERVRQFFEDVVDGDVMLPAGTPSLLTAPRQIQNLGSPDMIEANPLRYSLERGGDIPGGTKR